MAHMVLLILSTFITIWLSYYLMDWYALLVYLEIIFIVMIVTQM